MSSPYTDTPDFLATVTPQNYPAESVTVSGNSTATLNVPIDTNVQAVIVTVATPKPWKMTVTVTGHTTGATYGYFNQLATDQLVVPVNSSLDSQIDVTIVSVDAADRHAYARATSQPLATNVVTNTPAPSPADYYTRGASNEVAGTYVIQSFTASRVPVIYGVFLQAMISPSAASTNVGNIHVFLVDNAPDSFLLAAAFLIASAPQSFYIPFPQGLQIQGFATGAGCQLQVVTSSTAGTNTFWYNAVVWASL